MNPQELVVLIVAIGGLIPIVLAHRSIPRWFLLAYAFLLIGAITTNIEHLLWHDFFNGIEHVIGNMGAGIAFAVAAYTFRRSNLMKRNHATPVGDAE